jgi:hypothetical protein
MSLHGGVVSAALSSGGGKAKERQAVLISRYTQGEPHELESAAVIEEPNTEYVAIRYRRSTVNPMMAVANDGHAARTFGPDEIAPWRTAAQRQAADEVVAAVQATKCFQCGSTEDDNNHGIHWCWTCNDSPVEAPYKVRAALARLDRANQEAADNG